MIPFDLEFQMDFKIDTTQAQAARPVLDWNSKKAGEYPLFFGCPLYLQGKNFR